MAVGVIFLAFGVGKNTYLMSEIYSYLDIFMRRARAWYCMREEPEKKLHVI